MSLSAWEQQALDSIKDGLAGSDPALAARLAVFTRLTSSEEMPAREKVCPRSRRAVARPRPGARAGRSRLGISQVMVLVWLVTSVTLIAVAFALNRADTPSICKGPWITLCHGTTGTPQSASKLP